MPLTLTNVQEALNLFSSIGLQNYSESFSVDPNEILRLLFNPKILSISYHCFYLSIYLVIYAAVCISSFESFLCIFFSVSIISICVFLHLGRREVKQLNHEICLSFHLSIYIYLYIYQFIHLSILSISLSI